MTLIRIAQYVCCHIFFLIVFEPNKLDERKIAYLSWSHNIFENISIRSRSQINSLVAHDTRRHANDEYKLQIIIEQKT